MKRLGVIGTLVWDTIHGRDPSQPAVEEWGGIAYALAGLDAALPDDWQIVPLIKVGRDLAPQANAFLRSLRRTSHDARFIEVPQPNNRVTLQYESAERRCEHVTGGVPGWTWAELGPLVRDLDALYVNFIAGWELDLDTARQLRAGYRRFIYADLHSLFLARAADGLRILQPLPDAPGWFACFDTVQVNEDEFGQLGTDPLATAAAVLSAGCRTLIVTLGIKGAAYFDGPATPIRSGRIPLATAWLPASESGDPTGCGDVFGAVTVAQLLQGAALETAISEGCRLATRNVSHRGASGLRDHLLGRLATV